MNFPFENYSAFLFDLDGTVIDSMPLHNQAWIKALGDKGSLITDSLLQEYAGISTFRTIELFNQRFGWNFDPIQFTNLKEEIFLSTIDQVKVIHSVYEVILNYKNFQHN